MGDPAGVGPEIIVKACRRLLPRVSAGAMRLLVIGHRSALHAARDVLRETLDIPDYDGGRTQGVAVLAAGEERSPVTFGRLDQECGRFAYLAVERSVALVNAGAIDAIVTAPLNKEALNLAGYHFAGHTDMLAALTGTKSSIMLLAHGDMRVSHVTTHVALENVPALLTPERLRRTIDITHQAMLDLGIARPRIAVAALNPHAGENGMFGQEEIEEITPAVKEAVRLGIDARGPFPADSIFNRAISGEFDVVLVMYHDQGHIAVKVHGFEKSVSVALGLPFMRTSVDHGTAFDIAGKGIANSESIEEAIKTAVWLSQGKGLAGKG